MTSEEIDKLEAGPEMDAVVAKKVMKWIAKEEYVSGPLMHGGRMMKLYHGEGMPNEDGLRYSIEGFNPSTSISPAWTVIDKFNKEGKEWELVISKENCQISNMDCEGRILTGWNPYADFLVVDAPTAPLAICRFALKIVLPQDNTKSRVKGKTVKAHDRDIKQIEAVKTAVALTTSGVGTGFGGHGGGRR